MSARNKAFTLVLLVSFLVTGCGSAEPTATSVPATASRIVLEPTRTPRPPSATPAPPIATAAPPTPTDTPSPPPTPTSVPPTAAPSVTPTPAPLLLLENSPQPFGRTETLQVGVGDLDGDGDLDAVFANMAANDSQVWFNDGGIQGGTPGQFVDSGQRLSQQGHGVALGDLDSDGDLDIFMTCAHYGEGGGWSKKPSRVYLNDGHGTFQDSGQDLGDTDLSGNGVNLIDLEGDGDLDAHVVYYEADGMADRVYLNDGAARFSDSGLALTEDEIVWGDLDADGDVDIFAKTYGQGYRVLLNDGGVQGGTLGQFVPGWQMQDDQAVIGNLALADLDGDGDLDALIANGFRSEGSFPTRLLWNDGGVQGGTLGQFTDSGQELNKTLGAKFAVGDLNRDGALDVFVSNADFRPSEAWLNDGTGHFVDSGLRLQSPSHHLATWPSLGDLDGDGSLDIVEAGFEGKAEVWLNKTPLPAASGDRGLIAFVSTRDGNDEIYVMPVPGPPAQANTSGGDQRNLTRHPASDDDPRWSPDGSQIAFSSDRSGNYEIYVMEADGTDPQRLTQDPAVDAQPAWSRDGTQIAFVSLRDGNAEIYVMNVDGTNLQRVTHTDANEFEFDWSPDGTQIVFASSEGADANIYTMPAPVPAAPVNADSSDLRQLTNSTAQDFYPRWSPDGEQIAFLSRRDGGPEEIYVMDEDGTNQRRLTNNGAFDGAPSWSPDGAQLVFASDRDGNDELYVMNSDGAELGSDDVRRLTDNSAADRKPTWRPAIQASTNVPALAVISAGTTDRVELLHTLSGHSGRVASLAFSGDGAWLASSSWDGTIRLWDARSGQEVHTFIKSVNEAALNDIAASPDGTLLASADAIWDVESKQVLHTLVRGRQVPAHVAFSPDGSTLAVALFNQPIQLWDVASGQVVRAFEQQADNAIFSIAFSPDGALLATSLHDGRVRLWDVASGQSAGILEHGNQSDIHAVAFSPDGNLLASAGTDYTVRLWDVVSGQTVHTLRHGDGLYGVAFSPDGSLLASAGCDHTVKLWEVASGRLLRSLRHVDEVIAVAFSPDGALFASGGYDNQVYLWGVPR